MSIVKPNLKQIILVFIATMISSIGIAQAQNVGIGDTGDFTPSNTALLELRSSLRGFLMPRMTAAQRVAISNPDPQNTPHGLMVIQTDIQSGQPAGLWYYYNDGVVYEWRNILNTAPKVTFKDIQTETNTTATMTVGNGATIAVSGGTVQANEFYGTGSATAAVDLGTGEVAGTLGVTNGGTGLIAAPVAGSIIYSNGSTFVASTPTTPGQVLVVNVGGVPTWTNPIWSDNAWELSGNAGTTSGVNYIGTSDVADLSIRTNAEERININSTGLVTISENTDIEGNLDVQGSVSVANVTNKNTFNTNPAQVVDLTYNLPLTQGALNSILVNDGLGNLSWAAQSVTDLSFANITAGTNEGDSLVVGNGSSLTPTGTGIITATQFTGNGSTTTAVDLATNEVSGVLPLVNGGTNNSGPFPAGTIVYSDGAQLMSSGVGVAGQVLISNAGGAPAWVDNFTSTLPDGQVWIGNASSVATPATLSGDAQLINSAGAIRVTGLQTTPVSNAAPANRQMLTYNGTNWAPVTVGGDAEFSNNTGNLLVTGLRSIPLSATAPTTTGQVLAYNQTTNVWEPITPASGGSVTSVGLALPNDVFNITVSPVTTNGTLTAVFQNQNANTVFAGPVSGGAATPTFRALSFDDISTGILPVAKGGTGASALTGMLLGNGTNAVTGITNTVNNVTFWADNNYIGGSTNFQWNTNTNLLTVTGTINNNTTTNGFIMPRLTQTEINAVASPVTGTILYNTTTGAFQYYNGSAWVNVSPGNNFWGLTGNASTNPGTQYIGTSDAVDLSIRTSGTERLRLTADGNLEVRNSDNTARAIRLYEPSSSGSHYTEFISRAQDNNITYNLPTSLNVGIAGTGSRVLVSDPTGNTSNLSWASALDFIGGSTVDVKTVNSNYNPGASDYLIVVNQNNAVVTLPAASSLPGKVYYLVTGVGNSLKFSVNRSGSDFITGSSDLTTISIQGDISGFMLVSDGISRWYIVNTRKL